MNARLALILSGAGSLGSFEAGVLTAIGPRWLRWLTGPAVRAAVASAVKAKLDRVLELN